MLPLTTMPPRPLDPDAAVARKHFGVGRGGKVGRVMVQKKRPQMKHGTLTTQLSERSSLRKLRGAGVVGASEVSNFTRSTAFVDLEAADGEIGPENRSVRMCKDA